MERTKTKMSYCPCGSQINYVDCCGLYHVGTQAAPTPEKLMRSRYSAYALANIDYIQQSMRGKPLLNFNAQEAETWAKSVEWIGLKVIQVEDVSPTLGYVEFIARFLEGGENRAIHEISEFRRIDGQWFYMDGTHPTTNQSTGTKKVVRNMPCPCGSQKKFKQCHGKTS